MENSATELFYDFIQDVFIVVYVSTVHDGNQPTLALMEIKAAIQEPTGKDVIGADLIKMKLLRNQNSTNIQVMRSANAILHF